MPTAPTAAPASAPPPHGGAAARARRLAAWAPYALIAAATGLAYAGSLHGSFQFDDFAVIVDNPAIRSLAPPWPPRSARWLGELTFAVNFRAGGLDPFGYHLVNVLLHAANGLLVLALVRAVLRSPALRGAAAGPLLRGWLPLAAALLFALHPLATQAVTYVVQRFTVLATLFFLLSTLLYLSGRMALEEGRRGAAAWRLALCWLAAACAMKSKEIAFPLPAVALAGELLLLGGRPRRRLLLLLPPAAAALLVPLAHLAGAGPPLAPVLAETAAIPRGAYLFTQARVVVTYLRLLVLPVGLHLDWDVPLSTSPWEPQVLGALALLLGLTVAAFLLLRAARRTGAAAGLLAFLGAGWFLSTIALESSVVPIRDLLVEHRTYLPSVGFALVAATALLWALDRLRLPARPRVQVAGLLLVTAGPLAGATWARNAVWRDPLSLWTDSAEKSPEKARPHDELGIAHLERGELAPAIEELELALRLSPAYPEALVNLAGAYRATGRLDDAFRAYRRAVLVAPGMWQAHLDLGAMYEARGEPAEALREYREALRLAPGRPEPVKGLARLLARHPELGG